MTDVKIDSYCPLNKNEWRSWLESNHKEKDSVWLIVHKKASASPNLTWSESVDVALCFGWIDSVRRAVNNEKYMQYFGKRKPKSTWSKINKDKVEYLIEQGHMDGAGFRSIEIAKSNGSWTILDEVEALVIPEDLELAFKNRKDSMEYFERLSKSVRKRLLQWIVLAKRTETRKKRVLEIAENASKGLKPKQFR